MHIYTLVHECIHHYCISYMKKKKKILKNRGLQFKFETRSVTRQDSFVNVNFVINLTFNIHNKYLITYRVEKIHEFIIIIFMTSS